MWIKTVSVATGLLTFAVLRRLSYGAVQVPGSPSGEPAYVNEVLGVQLADTMGLRVVEDELLSEHSYGFSLVRGEDDDYSGYTVLRVALRYDTPPDVNGAVGELLNEHPEIQLAPTPVSVDGVEGQMIPSVPGRQDNTYLYLTAHDQLYELIYAGPTLGDEGAALLQQLHFVAPSRTVDDLPLERASEHLSQPSPFADTARRAPEGVESVKDEPPEFDVRATPQAGCANWPVEIFLQTPISSNANGTGTSKAGPSYYGDGFHRTCNRPTGSNDYYALDFNLRVGDVVYAPFEGRVLWAGWAGGGYSTYGRIVIVERVIGADRYWSLLAHLSSIEVEVGQEVKFNTPIGQAGASGNWIDSYWEPPRSRPHLHLSIYRNATLVPDTGGIRGGQSVQPLNMKFFGNGGGFYETIQSGQVISW